MQIEDPQFDQQGWTKDQPLRVSFHFTDAGGHMLSPAKITFAENFRVNGTSQYVCTEVEDPGDDF